jgi:hypothetical protein
MHLAASFDLEGVEEPDELPAGAGLENHRRLGAAQELGVPETFLAQEELGTDLEVSGHYAKGNSKEH